MSERCKSPISAGYIEARTCRFIIIVINFQVECSCATDVGSPVDLPEKS